MWISYRNYFHGHHFHLALNQTLLVEGCGLGSLYISLYPPLWLLGCPINISCQVQVDPILPCDLSAIKTTHSYKPDYKVFYQMDQHYLINLVKAVYLCSYHHKFILRYVNQLVCNAWCVTYFSKEINYVHIKLFKWGCPAVGIGAELICSKDFTCLCASYPCCRLYYTIE